MNIRVTVYLSKYLATNSLTLLHQITTFNISLVVHGTVSESKSSLNGKPDPYLVPKSMGIFRMLESPKNTTTASVAQRIKANHEVYEKQNAKKEPSEKKFYEERKYIRRLIKRARNVYHGNGFRLEMDTNIYCS